MLETLLENYATKITNKKKLHNLHVGLKLFMGIHKLKLSIKALLKATLHDLPYRMHVVLGFLSLSHSLKNFQNRL